MLSLLDSVCALYLEFSSFSFIYYFKMFYNFFNSVPDLNRIHMIAIETLISE